MNVTGPILADAAKHCWDVIVVGAGVAGSLAAHGLVRQGLAVLLVDRAEFPRYKVCGCCLNPATLAVLADNGLGELAEQCGAVPIRSLRLGVLGHRADIALPDWKVLSRQRLDLALVDAGRQEGVTFLEGTQAVLGSVRGDARALILRQDGREQTVSARLILAADGLASRLLDGEVVCAPASRMGAGVIVEDSLDAYESGVIHMACGSSGYVGLVRLEDGRLNLGAALDMDAVKEVHNPGVVAARLLNEVGWPALPGLEESPWRGTPTLTRQAVQPAAERVFAIGDAAGYVEPFTGEGMAWAAASATAVVPFAVQAVRGWQPSLMDQWASHERSRRARGRQLIRWLAWVSRRPFLARTLVGLLNHVPVLAAPLVHRIRARH